MVIQPWATLGVLAFLGLLAALLGPLRRAISLGTDIEREIRLVRGGQAIPVLVDIHLPDGSVVSVADPVGRALVRGAGGEREGQHREDGEGGGELHGVPSLGG